MGFDFIELAGNSYEKVENQISENIRLHLTQTKIFLTGGFRHVEPMCRAIQNRDADGIGIGRCSAAVPGNIK
jgi:2,4-dienoyl-CoA reductase-like NADH-dependent reductase (Old Yellow Enzyme family)